MTDLEERALVADPLILAQRHVDPNNPFKKDELFDNEFLFRETAYYIARLEQYENALIYYNIAISQIPDNIRSLLGRSNARAETCFYVGALADTYRAFKLAPHNLSVAAQRGLNLYFMSEFERALIHNLRCLPFRQKPEVFANGVRHCTIAIKNSAGEFAGHPLRDYFKILRKIAWIKNYIASLPDQPIPRKQVTKQINLGKLIFKRRTHKEKREAIAKKAAEVSKMEERRPKLAKGSQNNLRLKRDKSKPTKKPPEQVVNVVEHDEKPKIPHKTCSNLEIQDFLEKKRDVYNINIPPFTQEYPFQPLQQYTTNIENFMAEKYLDSMYREKIFLKEISHKHGLEGPNAKGSQKIKDLAKKAYEVVSYKQEILRTRRPFYHLKYQEEKCTINAEQRLKQEHYLIQQNYKKEAEALLKKMMLAYDTKLLHKILAACDQLNNFCQKKSKKYLPDRIFYLSEVYKIVRKAFYGLLRLNPIQFPWDQEKRIMVSFGLPISRTPSNDSMLANYQPIYIDVRKRIDVYEKRANEAETTEEMCYCFHELARLNVVCKQYDLARLHASNCLREASKDPEMFEWNINALILLTKVDLAQRIKPDARADIKHALAIATDHEDVTVQDYLKLCLVVIDKLEFDSFGMKILERRKHNILKIMQNAKMKEEFNHIFKLMDSQRAGRRSTIMQNIDGTTSAKASIVSNSIRSARKTTESSRAARRSTRIKRNLSVVDYLDIDQYI